MHACSSMLHHRAQTTHAQRCSCQHTSSGRFVDPKPSCGRQTQLLTRQTQPLTGASQRDACSGMHKWGHVMKAPGAAHLLNKGAGLAQALCHPQAHHDNCQAPTAEGGCAEAFHLRQALLGGDDAHAVQPAHACVRVACSHSAWFHVQADAAAAWTPQPCGMRAQDSGCKSNRRSLQELVPQRVCAAEAGREARTCPKPAP